MPDFVNVVSETTGISISAATIRHILHQANLHVRRPRWKPLLKPKNKQARLQFRNNHEDKPLSFWESVLWSDETKVNLFGWELRWRSERVAPPRRIQRKMSCTHSQTWWRQSDGFGLDECKWCSLASLYRWYHECRHVPENFKCEDDTISETPWQRGNSSAWYWSQGLS